MPMGKRATVQIVALVFGAIYLVAGILGFFNHALLGIFQVNLLHNLVHVAIGVGGLAAASSVANSRTFCQIAGGILFLLGLICVGGAHPFGLLVICGARHAPPPATAAGPGHF